MTPGECVQFLKTISPEWMHRELLRKLDQQDYAGQPVKNLAYYLMTMRYRRIPRKSEGQAQANKQKLATLFSGIGNYER